MSSEIKIEKKRGMKKEKKLNWQANQESREQIKRKGYVGLNVSWKAYCLYGSGTQSILLENVPTKRLKNRRTDRERQRDRQTERQRDTQTER